MPTTPKKPVACTRCTPLQEARPIRLPADLTQAILEVRDYLAQGILEERQHKGYPKSDFTADVKPKGPWPDILAGDFRCTACGRSFDLRAETYHGQGGFLGPTPDRK